MNNVQYQRASETVLGWRILSVEMKARYGKWIVASDSSWTTNFMVVVVSRYGREITNSKKPVYPFDERAAAEECKKWWEDNHCRADIHEVQF